MKKLRGSFSVQQSLQRHQTDPTQPPPSASSTRLFLFHFITLSRLDMVSRPLPPSTLNNHLRLQGNVGLSDSALHHFHCERDKNEIQRLKLSVSPSEGLQKFKTQWPQIDQPTTTGRRSFGSSSYGTKTCWNVAVSQLTAITELMLMCNKLFASFPTHVLAQLNDSNYFWLWVVS